MHHENNVATSPENQALEGFEQSKIINQKPDLSAIMHFNADRRFSITE